MELACLRDSVIRRNRTTGIAAEGLMELACLIRFFVILWRKIRRLPDDC